MFRETAKNGRGWSFEYNSILEEPTTDRPVYSIKCDISLWTLLASNALTMTLAISQSWNVITVMWIYWFQNMTICIFNTAKIKRLKDYSTKGVKINGNPIEPSEEMKNNIANHFIGGYTITHLGLAFFLLIIGSPFFKEPGYVILSAATFLINHGFSYAYNKESLEGVNIGRMYALPFLRLFPLTFTIVFCAAIIFLGGQSPMILFLTIKTIVDATTHIIEHQYTSA
ncbi:MAG: DUF6498-containing protein [Candidatus Altiarchaeota archaeon]